MGKPDLGAFAFNKRGWKVTKKEPSYYENFDRIFKKGKCENNCEDCSCKKENTEEEKRNVYRVGGEC